MGAQTGGVMRRLALILTCVSLAGFGTKAPAWEFSPLPICTLSHAVDQADIVATYDAALPEYTITITLRDGQWPDSAAFSIIFAGGRALTIGTDRHQLSPDRRALSVADTGFGNVLNGMQFNQKMVALTGAARVEVPLTGAADPVAAFRACDGVPSV